MKKIGITLAVLAIASLFFGSMVRAEEPKKDDVWYSKPNEEGVCVHVKPKSKPCPKCPTCPEAKCPEPAPAPECPPPAEPKIVERTKEVPGTPKPWSGPFVSFGLFDLNGVGAMAGGGYKFRSGWSIAGYLMKNRARGLDPEDTTVRFSPWENDCYYNVPVHHPGFSPDDVGIAVIGSYFFKKH